MTSTEGTTRTDLSTDVTSPEVTVTNTSDWGGRTIVLMSNGQARVSRMAYRVTVLCTSDRTDLTDEQGCDEYLCDGCWREFNPGYEFAEQGTPAFAHLREVTELRAELNEVKRQLEQEYLPISLVQQVGHDYSVQGEWCSVYEDAFSHLRTPYFPNGIPVLNVEDEVLVQVTYRMTVRADRRQRAGDTDYMNRSIDHYRVALNAIDPFDSSYEVISDITVADISVEMDY